MTHRTPPPRIRPRRLALPFFSTAVLFLLVAGSAAAQPGHSSFTVALMGGIGGATDADTDVELSNFGLQALFSFETDVRTRFVVRVGQHDLDAEDAPGELFDTELTYLNLAGEYRFAGGYYESGLFLGLGAYELDDAPFVEGETSLGLGLGATGDFRITDRFSIVAEVSGHYADLDHPQIFLFAHAGLAYHF